MRAVAAGKPFFSPAVTAVLVEDYVRRLQARGLTDSYHLLTDREKEVLQLLAEGRSNKEVATLLDLGLSTVETHRANLMQKLNLHNTAEIVLYAVRKGIIHYCPAKAGHYRAGSGKRGRSRASAAVLSGFLLPDEIRRSPLRTGWLGPPPRGLIGARPKGHAGRGECRPVRRGGDLRAA